MPSTKRSQLSLHLSALLCIVLLGCADDLVPTGPGDGAQPPQAPTASSEPAGMFSDLLVPAQPEELVLLSEDEELQVGIYRYKVMSAAAPPVTEGDYLTGMLSDERYLRRVTYSSLEDGTLTLGTVPAYWPEVINSDPMTFQISLDGSTESSVLSASPPFDTGPLSFSYNLCDQVGDFCQKGVHFGCQRSLGTEVCGNVKHAQVDGQLSLAGDVELVWAMDPGAVIGGKAPVYSPCNAFPAACLYTGVCIVGTDVLISLRPLTFVTCERLDPGRLPTVVPPSISNLAFNGSGLTVASDVAAAISGDFRLQVDQAIPGVGKTVRLPPVSGPLGLCAISGKLQLGVFLRLGAEWSDFEATASHTVRAAYDVSNSWTPSAGFNPYFRELGEFGNQFEVETQFEKPDSLTLKLGVLAKLGADFSQLFDDCPFELDVFFETFVGAVMEDVVTRPTPCTTEDRQLVATGCEVNNWREDIDFYDDLEFALDASAQFRGFEPQAIGPYFKDNPCKRIPSWRAGTCRVDVTDYFGRGDLHVVVEISGAKKDLDTDGYDLVLDRRIPNDARVPGSIAWEPVGDPIRLVQNMLPAGEFSFSSHPDVELVKDNEPPPPYKTLYTPYCRTWIPLLGGFGQVQRSHCTLVAGVDHALKLEGVAANCFVEDAIHADTTLTGEHDFYRVIQLAPDSVATETFKVICEDRDLVFGTLELTVTTSGQNLDRDGYSVIAANAQLGTIAANDSQSYQLPAGDYDVALGATSIADNCSLQGDNPHPFTIVAGDSSLVSFDIECAPTGAGVGSIDFSVATTGDDIDPDGYFVEVDGSTVGGLPSNGTLNADGIPSGIATVELIDVAGNCSVDGSNPRNTTISVGEASPVHFDVSCVTLPVYGDLHVTTASTGRDLPAGYTLQIGSADLTIAANGTLTTPVEIGPIHVGLTGVSPNCSVDAPNPRIVDVVEGAAVSTTFDITCKNANAASATSIGGSIEILGVLDFGTDEGSEGRQRVSDQRLEIALGGTVSGSGIMSRDYNLDATGTGRVSGAMEIDVSYNGQAGLVSGQFHGTVVNGRARMSFNGQGSGSLSNLTFQIDFEGPLEGPFSYSGRVLQPNRQGPKVD